MGVGFEFFPVDVGGVPCLGGWDGVGVGHWLVFTMVGHVVLVVVLRHD